MKKRRKKRLARNPTVVVDPKKCKFEPPGRSHASGKKHGGYVNFQAKAGCDLLFTNPDVFGCSVTSLSRGDNLRYTQIEEGHTYVMIAGCTFKIPRSLGAAAASDPKDIIVP